MTAWDVRDSRGALVTGLSGLAGALRMSRAEAAKALLADETMAAAAPRALVAEAKGFKPKPGGGTPPPIANGSFVSWSGGKGKVDLIVSTGKVPGVEGDVEGTEKSPAARVVVYENGKPTRKKVGVSTHTLKRIPPIKGGDEKKTADPAAVLVSMLADHESTVEALALPEHAAVTGRAVKAVYDRGLAAWPGEDVTVLDAKAWALGRVDYFLKAATGENVNPGHDADLLADGHPAKATPPPGFEEVDAPPATDGPVDVPDGAVVLARDDIEAEMKALLDA